MMLRDIAFREIQSRVVTAKRLTTTWCFVSKKSDEYPGNIVVPSKPSCVSSNVDDHSHTPPFDPLPPFSINPIVALEATQ